MTRRDIVLMILASAEGRPFTPVQLQKATFLIFRNIPVLVDEGPTFNFIPYDYGPFDPTVYGEASALATEGHAVSAPSGSGSWRTFAATDEGVAEGRALLNAQQPNIREYIESISNWVRSQSFRGLLRKIYELYPEMKVNSVFRG